MILLLMVDSKFRDAASEWVCWGLLFISKPKPVVDIHI